MANTALGTPYVTSSDYVTSYPTTSLALANAIDAFGGVRVYATEALRDAAITSPFEGMVAYITASPTTQTDATGATKYLPTGIITVYNGATWVCTSEVGAFTAAGGTYSSTIYGPTLSGSPGTNPSITIKTGATALVTITADISVSATMTVGVDVAISGATTRLAGVTSGQALNWAKSSDVGLLQTVNHSFIVDGLSNGVNIFTLNYSSNNTATITKRRITVKGLL